MGPTGKAVKVGRGRAAVTGDDRRKSHCPDVWGGKERREVPQRFEKVFADC